MLASVYEEMGERDKAANTYAHIVEMSPDDAEAWEHLGTWRSLQGQSAEAIRAYERAVELDPGRYTAHFSLADVYLEAERFDEARRIYHDLIESRDHLLPKH